MYLKSIEVQGFKSFANKIVFEFHNGITGIVGPNGSGKSNVSDAVRWVLGEQSAKQLRGGNMQDVIFSGTELRKPQGYAYVAITLDNDDHKLPVDFDEVKVSRRLYRSGESEYMINGSPCRLKDINEIFYDTGIGKEGYSIIGQGQIDLILSGKPEDRRELFDEAAGITKFKRRKALAQKKLENEQANLVRVSDILSELEKQVEPLRVQSEAAKEYLHLKDELKNYDVNQFLLESGELKKNIESIEEKTKIAEADLSDAGKDSEKLKKDYEDLENLIHELDTAIAQKREKINSANVKTGDLNGRINVLNEQINTEKMNAEHINSRMETIDSELREHSDNLEKLDKEKNSISDDTSETFTTLKQAESTLQKADENIMLLDQKLEDGKASMIAAINERAEISAKGERYETLLEQIQVRSSEVAQKILKIKSDESVISTQYDEEKKKFDEIEASIQKLETELKEKEGTKESCDRECLRLSRILGDSQTEYQQQSTRLESLRNLAERYDGYGNSIKRVMETRDRIRGIHGVVADLITVEKEHETAIETALGGRIQNVVTDSEETAKQLIEHLKRNKFGRATFLPLTSVNTDREWNPGTVMNEPGIIGVASDLVKSEKQYTGLVRNLLGRYLVVDNIDHAIAIERKYHYEYRIVTGDGELLSPGGSMSGGAFKNASNLLGRKREIDDLEEGVRKVLEKTDRAEKELTRAREALKNSQTEIEAIRSRMQEALIERNTSKLSLSRLEEKKNEVEGSATDLETEHKELGTQAREIGADKERVLSDIEALEVKRTSMEAKTAELTGKLEEAKNGRQGLVDEVTRLQVEASGVKQKLSFIEENLKRVKAEMEKLNAEKTELAKQTEDSTHHIREKKDEIASTLNEIVEVSDSIKMLEEEVQEKTGLKESRADEQKAYFDKRDSIAERIASLDKEVFRLRSQREKCDEKLQTQTSYMWAEYELTYQTAEPFRDEELNNLSEITKMIASLKSDIHNLGSVNVNAIEDYKQISTRYEFMNSQHADLIEAQNTLLKVIDELDTGMRRQFENQFGQIADEFDKVFKELFGGGRGQLKLDEDADMLEAGIQIIAEPPGKKLQNMMQLSGGEKALTAIALLFAIQNLRPSPFALLDEIEAALDDSNVERFAKYLQKLTKNTQFIVITHRRGTMVSADRLYGITMQEKGVSTLVSVKLIEDKLDA